MAVKIRELIEKRLAEAEPEFREIEEKAIRDIDELIKEVA